MEINVIGRKGEGWNHPKLMDDDRVHFHELPDFGLNFVDFYKFLRRTKKCMVLYWRVDEETTKKLPPIPRPVLKVLARTILKKPGGPAIVIEDTTGKNRYASVGDLTFNSKNEDYLGMIRKAYFLAECGHPSSIYKEPKQRERISWLKKQADNKVLEIGCSTGYVLNYIGGGTGVDVDEIRLQYAQEKYPQSKFLKMDAAKMPFEDCEFDTVMIPDILEHVEMPHAQKIVDEAYRVGKKLVITVPNAGKPNYDKDLVENPEHRWYPTEALMRKMVGPDAAITLSENDDFIYVVRAHNRISAT
jgi:SAM-dependent methyltransferase